MQEFTVTVKMKVNPDERSMPVSEGDVAHILQRLINAGIEDAMNAPDDFEDEDADFIKNELVSVEVIQGA